MTRRALALLLLLLLGACSESTPQQQSATPTPAPAPEPAPVLCDCELSSWVVAARGRHLHLDIDCPTEYDHLDGRIEFTSAALRADFDASLIGDQPPRLVRMSPGGRLYSPASDPKPRSEASWEIDVTVAAWLQRDIAFSAPYVLLGTNSNSAMRAVLESAGLDVPPRVLGGAGMFGEFPGIDRLPGLEIDAEKWPLIGLPEGPVVPDGPLPEGWERVGEGASVPES